MRKKLKTYLTLTSDVNIINITENVSCLGVRILVHENVEKVRMAKGITKTYIANKLGMSLQGYIHLMSGNVRLDVERLKIIAAVLGLEPGIFFDDGLTASVIEQINDLTTKKVKAS